jgi:hypothetical protein
VQSFLTQHQIEFGFGGSLGSVHAIARNLRGSTTIASKSLQFHFQFDKDSKLKSIDATIVYTGP